MRGRALALAVLCASALLPAVTSSAATAADRTVLQASPTASQPWKTSISKRMRPRAVPTFDDQVLAATNLERTRRGLRALAPAACPDAFADSWARTLASVGSLSHQALSPILTTCLARRVGENVAYGNVTAAELVAMWMASPGHRANILEPAYTHLGVGSVRTSTGRVYGVQVFVTL